MQLSADKVKKACKRNGLRLQDALEGAGVSKNAYYSLVRNDTIVPKSVLALAEYLDVDPIDLLDHTVGPQLHARLILRRLDRIMDAYPDANRENVRHTLLLMEEPPVDRLERGLRRGRALDLHG